MILLGAGKGKNPRISACRLVEFEDFKSHRTGSISARSEILRRKVEGRAERDEREELTSYHIFRWWGRFWMLDASLDMGALYSIIGGG